MPASLADKADIDPQPDDFPCEAAAGVFFSQTHDVVDFDGWNFSIHKKEW